MRLKIVELDTEEKGIEVGKKKRCVPSGEELRQEW
jgi:hypothetical protein